MTCTILYLREKRSQVYSKLVMKEDATFYYIVWTILLIIALTEHIRKKPFNNSIITAVFMMSAVIVACRVEVGADWSNYKFFFYNGYEEVGNRDASLIDPLFMLIRNIFYYLDFTHAFFFFVLSLASLFAIHKAADLFGVKYFMIAFLVYYSMFFLNYQFNIVRHGVMASFIWLSFAYKSKGEIKAAIVSALAALGIHIVALIFIPCLFLLNKKFSKPFVFFILVVSYLAFFLHFSERIISLFPILSLLDRTATYVNSERYTQDVGLTIGSQILVFLFVFLYFKYKALYNNSSGFRILLNAVLFYFLLLCFLNSFSAIVSRVCNVFFMTMVFLLPLFLELLRKQINRIAVVSLVVCYTLLTLPKTFSIKEDGYSEMLPYRFEIMQLIEKNAK